LALSVYYDRTVPIVRGDLKVLAGKRQGLGLYRARDA
jgi:hypothetical protein